jgi:hypothetical protein
LIDFNPGQSLDSHIITGDGRANENIGLTAVHHVFHEEHNAEVANTKASLIAEYNKILNDPGPNGGGAAAAAFLAPWQSAPGVWDGEKLYQAARLITESEYITSPSISMSAHSTARCRSSCRIPPTSTWAFRSSSARPYSDSGTRC